MIKKVIKSRKEYFKRYINEKFLREKNISNWVKFGYCGFNKRRRNMECRKMEVIGSIESIKEFSYRIVDKVL